MMDVHKVAQQIAKWWIEAPGYWRDPDMPPDVAWMVDFSFIDSCYREARTPWLPAVLEDHTRAHVAQLEGALRRISEMCPATADMSVAHMMAAEADQALGGSDGR
jgi:hypothetical protein